MRTMSALFYAYHEDGLAHSRIHVARGAVAVGHGILARVDDGTAAVVVVEAVVLAYEPLGVAVVVLVDDVHRMTVPPSGRIGAPRLDVADALHLGEACLDGIVEHAVALGVMVALVAVVLHVPVIILVSYLNEGDVEGLRVPVLGTHLAVVTRNRPVGILQGAQTFVYPGL